MGNLEMAEYAPHFTVHAASDAILDRFERDKISHCKNFPFMDTL
jgi:hypothetical protein